MCKKLHPTCRHPKSARAKKRLFRYPADTKTYTTERLPVEDPEETETVKKHLEKTFSDPLVKSLAPTSLFTRIQLESLIIDYILGALTTSYISPEEKARMRNISRGKTRGSYNRTLAQSKRKLTSLLSSIVLIGYLGILDTNSVINLAETVANLHKLQEQYLYSPGFDEKEPNPELRHELSMQVISELKNRLKELTERPGVWNS